jgi:hypothetical protein
MDAGEFIKLLVVLVILTAPAIGQIVAKMREGQNPPANPGGKPPRVPRMPRPPQEQFKDEIEEFLRRAAQPRQPAGGQTREKPRAEAAAKTAPAAEEPAQSPVTVVEHVRKHLDTSDFQRRTQQLGDEVAQADDKIDARVHEVFEHQLSQFDWRTPQELAAAGAAPTPAVATSAAGLLPLLADPQSLRQAILLAEILERPEHRWA